MLGDVVVVVCVQCAAVLIKTLHTRPWIPHTVAIVNVPCNAFSTTEIASEKSI